MKIYLKHGEDEFDGVYVRSFNDNYHRLATDPSNELEREARRIRRRYRHMADYQNAVTVYNEYMTVIKIKHGGPDIFKIKLKAGVIDDFIPPKPRMRPNAKSKIYMKHKILVSDIDMKKVDFDEVFDYIEEEYSDRLNDGEVLTINTEQPLNQMEQKALKHLDVNKLNLKSKIARNVQAQDFLEEYFLTKNAKKKAVKEEEFEHISLTDIIEGRVPNFEDEEDDDETILHNGAFIKRSAVRELLIYEQLAEFNWDHIKLMKQSGISKKYTKIEERRYKKIKNSKKKGKGKNKDRKKNDNMLMHTIMNTDHDTFQSFEKEMMDFTSEAFNSNL